MALVLSGSIDISGSMTATTIVVSAPGVAGMVSSSAQITELAPLMAYTASLKGASIVSSSQQITNYYKFAETASANTFYGTQTISGSLIVSSSAIFSSGSVGIGRRPEFTLDVDGDIALNRFNKLQFTGGTVGDRARSYLSGDGNNNIFVYGPSNNLITTFGYTGTVGIGPLNSTPDTKLHISGSDGIKIQAGGNADTPGLTIINHTNQYGWAKFGGGLQGNGRGYATISNWNGSSVAEHVRISGDGYLRLAGTGIQFNGDTADANSLDDYEEGTWTPVIGGSTSESGQAYSGQTGHYTKVGRLVTASFRVVLSTRGTITGDVAIKGLPFTANSAIGYGAGTTLWETLAISWSSIFLVVNSNTTFATLEGVKSAGVASIKLASADLGNTSQFNGSITYWV